MTLPLGSRISAALRDVPNFPKPGIVFKDISPLLANAALLAEAVQAMAGPFVTAGISHVVGIESRGFLFGVPIALSLGSAFVAARKPGKLPWHSVRENFQLEYGTDALEMHVDAFGSGCRVLIVDDVMATGGTVAAACRLCERLGGAVAGISVLAEIRGLRTDRTLGNRTVHSLLSV